MTIGLITWRKGREEAAVKVGGADMVFSPQSSDAFLSTLIFSSSPLIFTTHLSLPSVYSPVVRNYLAPREGDMAGNPKLRSESFLPVSDSDAK